MILKKVMTKLRIKFTKAYWKSSFSERWHSKRRVTGVEEIANFSSYIIPKIRNLEYTTVVEVGTGSGLLSYYLSHQLNDINFIGIDINRKSIEKNNENFKSHNLTYETAEISNYIAGKHFKNIILIAYNTFSYFEMIELEKLFRKLTANIDNIILIANGEKNKEDKSVQKETANLKIYRHNFKKLMMDAGFDKVEIDKLDNASYLYSGYYSKKIN